ncbi:MAG: type III-B CRISPR module RAMP protein Cmr6 [Chitinophagales bacterium]|nr:type III-B CRISPR module RAMP protein Cmr6 [Chitinophagales bacterium]
MGANTAYLFQRNYYNKIDDDTKLDWKAVRKGKNASDQEKKDIEKFFKKKNDTILQTDIIPIENEVYKKDFSLQLLYPGLLYGSGITHEVGAVGEFKIGFQLDHTTGMPIIAGSSVKGMLRAYFPQFLNQMTEDQEIKTIQPFLTVSKKHYNNDETILKNKKKHALYIDHILKQTKRNDYEQLLDKIEDGEDQDFAPIYQKIHQLEYHIFEGVNNMGKRNSIYKTDIFFDAIPSVAKDGKLFGDDAITPHGTDITKNPLPLLFLKVMPNVVYDFHFKLIVTDLGNEKITAEAKMKLFETLIVTHGVGAKTNVGYGQFKSYNASKSVSANLPKTEIDFKFHLFLKKRTQLTGVVESVDDAKVEMTVETVKGNFTVYKKRDKLSNVVSGDRVIIQIEQDYIPGSGLSFSAKKQ